MSLNAVTLAAALLPDIKDAFTDHLDARDNAALLSFCTALSTAIASKVIAHIQTNASVSVVTACGAGAGTGTGTVA